MTNKDLHYLLKLILLYFFFQVTPIASGQDKKWWTDFNNPKLSDTTRLRTIHNTASDLSATNPDSALLLVAAQKEVYLIVECGTLEYCQAFGEWKNRMQDHLCKFGEFSYDSVFAVKSKWARAEVFRVRPAA